MSDYTPTTEEVRGAYRAWHDGQGDDHAQKPTWSEQEFDRWFQSEIEKAARTGAEEALRIVKEEWYPDED